jgi:hypothetical protein
MKRSIQQHMRWLAVVLILCSSASSLKAQPLYIRTIAGAYGARVYKGDGGLADTATIGNATITGSTIDAQGNFYFTDGYPGPNGASQAVVRKIDVNGKITRYAGNGVYLDSYSGDGGPALQAGMSDASRLAASPNGDLYFGDGPYIRKVTAATGIISTYAGKGTAAFQPGANIKDVTLRSNNFFMDRQGNIYLANETDNLAAIFKVDASTGIISLYRDLSAQTYEDMSPIDFSSYLDDMAIDASGNLFICDGNHSVVYKIGSDGILVKIGGVFNSFDFTGDGGQATQASMSFPYFLCLDPAGNIFVYDYINSRIRRIDAVSGIITTVAGNGDVGSASDVDGPAINQGFDQLNIIRSDPNGNIFYVDGYYRARELYKPTAVYTFTPVPVKTYGDADFTLSASATNGSVATFSSDKPAVLTVASGGTAHIAAAGTVTLTAHFPAVGTDAAATQTQTITIAKKKLTVTAEDKSIQEGDPIPTLTLVYNGFISGDGPSSLTTQPALTTTATSASAPGQYPITASGGQSDNYDFNYEDGTLTISQPAQLPQTITFSTLSAKTYGDADFDPGATSDNTTIPIQYNSNNSAVATVVNGRIHIIGVGMTTITASQPGNGVYAPAQSVSQSLTIGRTTVNVTADDKTVVYGAALPVFTVTYSGWVNGDGPSVLTTTATAGTAATVGSPAGAYPITASGAAAANYQFTYTPGTLKITAQTQTITFGALPAKTYADADFAPGATSSNATNPITWSSSDVNVATITAGGLIHIIGTGTTSITASQAAGGSYSAAPDVLQTLTVTPAPLVISPNDESRAQGQPNPDITFNYAGLREGESSIDALLTQPTATTTANDRSYPGIYPITAGGAVANSHYTLSYRTGTLTVTVDSTQAGGGDKLDAWSSSPGMLQVNIFTATNQNATIQLFSLYGQPVVNKPVYLVNASNSYSIPVANLAPGLYIIKVTGQYLRISEKIRIGQ